MRQLTVNVNEEIVERVDACGTKRASFLREAVSWYTGRYLRGEAVPLVDMRHGYDPGKHTAQVGVNLPDDEDAAMREVVRREQERAHRLWKPTQRAIVEQAMRAYLDAEGL